MFLPPSTGSGESDLVSASFVMVLPVLSSTLFPYTTLFRSTPEVVLAVLEMFVVREESTFTTRVTDLLETVRTHVRTHATNHARMLPPPVTETKLVPAGIASDRLTPVASDGPLFVTVSV